MNWEFVKGIGKAAWIVVIYGRRLERECSGVIPGDIQSFRKPTFLSSFILKNLLSQTKKDGFGKS